MYIFQDSSNARLYIDAALELVWPTRCAGCERTGTLLCTECTADLLSIEKAQSCEKCGAPFGKVICTECYDSSGKRTYQFAQAISAVEMSDLSGRLTVLYKDANEHRLSSVLAEVLLQAIPEAWLRWAEVLTWIPSDKKALRRRGFDHMEKLAFALSSLTNQNPDISLHVTLNRLLAKQTCRDQRGLNKEERAVNLQQSFSVITRDEPLPSRILLIDDVFTTGATLDAAALTLSEAGAHEVRALSFVRVW